jgi:hypothetical protein
MWYAGKVRHGPIRFLVSIQSNAVGLADGCHRVLDGGCSTMGWSSHLNEGETQIGKFRLSLKLLVSKTQFFYLLSLLSPCP